MHRGWAKFWRKSIESDVFVDELWRLWSYCLFRANHTSTKVFVDGLAEPVEVQRGQFITGRDSLHEALYKRKRKKDPCAKTLWRRLQLIEKLGNLSIQTSNRFSMITLCTYEIYNPPESETVQPGVHEVSSRCPAGVQPVSTEKKLKKDKKLKNDKEDKGRASPYSDAFTVWWDVYPRKAGKLKAAKAYEAAASRIKAERSCDPLDAYGRLLDAVVEFAASDKGRGDKQFIPHPTTWLNEGRYDDDPEAWKDAKSGTNRIGDGPGQRHDPSLPARDPRAGLR